MWSMKDERGRRGCCVYVEYEGMKGGGGGCCVYVEYEG